MPSFLGVGFTTNAYEHENYIRQQRIAKMSQQAASDPRAFMGANELVSNQPSQPEENKVLLLLGSA